MVAHVKGATGRDYKAEYAARKARAAARNLTTAQARGHPARGQLSIKALRMVGLVTTTGSTSVDATRLRYYRAAREIAAGKSKAAAARVAGISVSTFNRLNRELGLVQSIPRYKPDLSGILRPSGVRGYQVEQPGSTPILTREGRLIVAPAVDRVTASLLGRYWNAVDRALKGDDRDLQRFRHAVVYDLDGNAYHLMTDINAYRRWYDMRSGIERQDFARTFYTGRRVVYAPAA
jgi:hypothetical protein